MKPASQQDLLANLHDIHLPEAINLWPPAPIWWLAAAILLVFTIWLARYYIKRHRAHLYRRQAVDELDKLHQEFETHKNQAVLLSGINALLKRTAISHLGRQKGVEHLSGKAWVNLLRELYPQNSSRSACVFEGLEHVFTDAIYAPATTLSDAHLAKLFSDTQLWLKQHRTSNTNNLSMKQSKPKTETDQYINKPTATKEIGNA